MKFFRVALSLSVLTLSNACYSQGLLYQTDTIASTVFGEQRIVDLAFPIDYNREAAQTYMRIYIFDAQFGAFFKMTCEIAEYLRATGSIQPFVAVGIHTENRPKEFTPAPRSPSEREGWAPNVIGEADGLRSFISSEVEPFVEARFPSSPLRVAIGHSLAGTFVLHDALRSDALFKAVIAVSPNTVYDNGQLVDDLKTVLRYPTPPNHYAFLTAGTEGNMENSFRTASAQMDSIYAAANKKSNFIFTYSEYTGLGHSETPAASISDGLIDFGRFLTLSEAEAEAFLEDKSLSYFDHLKAWYAEKWYWLEYDRLPSAAEINSLGYIAAETGQWDQALDIFDWAITVHPGDANLYDSRAEALLKVGRKIEALAAYRKALEVIETQKPTMNPEDYTFYLEMIRGNLKAAEGN